MVKGSADSQLFEDRKSVFRQLIRYISAVDSSGIKRNHVCILVYGFFLVAEFSAAEVYLADPQASSGPNYYLHLLSQLRPGDTLVLPAGIYSRRLDLSGLEGTSSAWITVTGPESGGEAIINTGSTCCNTVQLSNTAFVAVKNLTIDANSERIGANIDGINAKGKPTHDILIENCRIIGTGYHQQTVGISTKSPAWNWVIRSNIIEGAGTGAYFGNSDGSAPFVAGVIEGNLFIDSIGYNLQIKHQQTYEASPGMPTSPRRTKIRHNVFAKTVPLAARDPARVDGRRPNLLVGGFAAAVDGADDGYEIYGNFFYRNPDNESLIQASGRVAIHDNILIGPAWAGVVLRHHDFPLESAGVYNNTIYGPEVGIYVASQASDGVSVIGNLVFGPRPVSGNIDRMEQNITDTINNAGIYVQRPSLAIEEMDFYPRAGQVVGDQLKLESMSYQAGFDEDFNGRSKRNFVFRGAYSGEGQNPGWKLDIARKPLAPLVGQIEIQE